MEPTGLKGSGRAKDALKELVRLGIIMGSSSVDESSPDEKPSSRSPCRIVVSARARPRESIVNLTDVRVRGCGAVSGIDARPDSRCWLLRGDALPEGRAMGLPDSTLDVLLACETGRIAGANFGSTGRF